MIASRSFYATIERTVGTSSIRSVDCNSARLSIIDFLHSTAQQRLTRQNLQFRKYVVSAGSSCDGPAAVDRQHRPRNIPGGVARKKDHHRADAFERDEAAARLAGREIVAGCVLHRLAGIGRGGRDL